MGPRREVCDSHSVEPAGNRAFAPPPLVAAATLELDSPAAERVGWGFIALYTLAFMSTSLLFLAPLLVTLALKVNSLVGIQQAPSSLALVAGTGALWPRWHGDQRARFRGL